MNQHSLIFFDKFPPEYLREDNLISALQSLESGLVLLGHGRYPNVVALMTECIEKMLKNIARPNVEDRTSLEKLMRHYNSTEGVSPDLAKKSQEIRNFRNAIIHGSYSPKDDEKCIELAFSAAIPYIDHLVRTITSDSLTGIFTGFGEVSNEWLGEIFLDTRRAIQKKINRRDKASNTSSRGDTHTLRPALFFLNMVFKRIALTGYNIKAVTPSYNVLEADFYWYNVENDNGHLWEFKKKRFTDFYREEFDGTAILLDEFSCIRCGNDSIVALENDGKIVKVGCAGCEYTNTDADVISVFFQNRLSEAMRAKLISDSSPLADEEIF